MIKGSAPKPAPTPSATPPRPHPLTAGTVAAGRRGPGAARRGDVIVLGAIGAGFLFGSLVFRLPEDLVAADLPAMARRGRK